MRKRERRKKENRKISILRENFSPFQKFAISAETANKISMLEMILMSTLILEPSEERTKKKERKRKKEKKKE